MNCLGIVTQGYCHTVMAHWNTGVKRLMLLVTPESIDYNGNSHSFACILIVRSVFVTIFHEGASKNNLLLRHSHNILSC